MATKTAVKAPTREAVRKSAKASVMKAAARRGKHLVAKVEIDQAISDSVFDAAEAGIPYREIAADLEMSTTRVDQILQAERRRRGIPHTNTNKISKASLARAAKKAAKVASKEKK